jgi:acyl-CoA thioester hydrolase
MRLPLATRYADFDTKGHVNNAVYLTYFEMARATAWVEGCGGSADFPFILAEASVKYVSEAMIGQTLDIELTTVEVRTKAWVWAYTIRDVSDGRVVAEGRTVQVMYDYERKATIPIPDALRARLAAL